MNRVINITIQIKTTSNMELGEIEHEIQNELESCLFVDDVSFVTVEERPKQVRNTRD